MMKLFTVSGKFVVPGSRKVVSETLQKVCGRDVQDACRSAALFLSEKYGVRVDADFVRMNLRTAPFVAPEARSAERAERDRAALALWDAHVAAGTLPDGASSLEDFGYVGSAAE